MAVNPAVFIDKDGTLVHDEPYNVDPDRITLRDDAGTALRALQEAGFELIVVSNQPGVALGRFPESALTVVYETLNAHLEHDGVHLSGFYYCPHHPSGNVLGYCRTCRCRKPHAGLLRRAARDLDIDLRRSWMIGDILDDVEAGRRAGCRTVLLDVSSETEWRRSRLRRPHFVAANLTDASRHILERH